jgi:hypothetical protein
VINRVIWVWRGVRIIPQTIPSDDSRIRPNRVNDVFGLETPIYVSRKRGEDQECHDTAGPID